MVDELGSLSRQGVALADFYRVWLERLLRAVAAPGGCVWQLDEQAGAEVVVESHFPAFLRETEGRRQEQRVRAAAWRSAPHLVEPRRGTAERSCSESPSDGTLAVCTVPACGAKTIVAEILLGSSTIPAVHEGVLRLLEVFREVAVDYHRRRETDDLRRLESDSRRFDQLAVRLHGRLNPLETAYALANDGRAWLGCDRVSVAKVSGGRAKLLAVSGVDLIDPRADEVLRLERLATAVAEGGEPVYWTAGMATDLSPQLDALLQEYVDRIHARSVMLVPLWHRPCDRAVTDPAEKVGVLIAESFAAALDDERFRPRLRQLAGHAETAMGCALEHDQLPLRALQTAAVRLVRGARRRGAFWMALAATLATAVTLLTVVPADFTVEARGMLEPQRRRNIFAPSDGVVERVAAEHGETFAVGDEILTLRNDRLELDHSRVSGEVQTLRARLAAIRAKRSSRGVKDEGRDDERQLAAEEEIDGLEGQLRVLDAQRAELHVASPLAGTVLTWNAHDLLQDRPVRQGQLLLTLADPSGPWQIELNVPDASVGHVLAARRQDSDELPVTFLLATNPARTYAGWVERIALDTSATQDQTAAARVIARIDANQMDELRPGAGVVARVHCGRRSLGYVWLHPLIDAIRLHVLF